MDRQILKGTEPRNFSALVGGKLIAAMERELIERPSPAYGTIVSRYPAANGEDIRLAIASAKKAAEGRSWKSVPGAERARLINKVAEFIYRDREEFARIECLEGGKPISNVDGEIQASISLWEYAATLARHCYGDTYDQLGDHTMGLVLREPVDVVAMITPWNFPLLIASQKLPFALAMGCCAVLKPSELTSGTTLKLGELLIEAGLPDGVVNILSGTGPDVGQRLCEHADVDMISFTGSTRVGKLIGEIAGRMIKKVSLELGGKSAQIVCADANLDEAADAVVRGATFNSGQVCVSGSRLLVEKKIAQEFTGKVAERMAAMKVGDPMDKQTQLGPLISGAQFERVSGYIKTGLEEGARMMIGEQGGAKEKNGFFVYPTIFADVKPEMRIAREEIFGPVLSVMEFETMDEALKVANSTLYGLAAGVWTRDVDRAFYFARRLKAGTVEVNTFMAGEPELPLVGFRESGLGHEKGRFAVDEYTELKTVQFKFGS